MSDKLFTLCVLAALTAGCASPRPVAPVVDPVEPVAMSVDDTAEVGVAEASFRSAAAEQQATDRTAGVREVLADPAFQRRFAESYLSETEIEPSVTLDEREVMLEILEVINAQKLDDAAERLIAECNPASSAVFDFTLGNVRFQQERFDDAVAAYQAAITKFPKFRRAYGNLAQIHFRNAAFVDARNALAKVVELGGGDAVTYGTLGITHLKLGASVAAESAFRMAMMLAGDNVDWQMGLAQAMFEQSRYADAGALFDTMLKVHPERADLWLAQGEALARQGQMVEAAHAFEVVAELGAATADSLNNLGDIYARESLFDLAVDAYVRALRIAPDAPVDRALRAAPYLSANGGPDATKTLVAAIEATRGERLSNTERKTLLGIRARIAVAEGAGDEEARILQQMVELDPLDGEALILLGQHAARSGDKEKAVFWYERAESLEAFEADAKVRHAQMLAADGRYAEALPLLRRAQTLKPRDNVQDYLDQVERIAQSR